MKPLSSLSMREKIGQMLLLGWMKDVSGDAARVNDHARECIKAMGCSGLVMMGRNMQTPEQTLALTQELQSLAQIPLLLPTDQEGGLVNRLLDPLTAFPGNMALGATRSPELAYEQARATAKELRAIGINWNFAPVVDVNNNPANPVIGTRSYGEDPERVASLSEAVVRGYQENGVLACAKHFPGHGDTSIDSHLDLPVITADRQRLDQVELLPFKRLIGAGVGSIMTAHLVASAIDSELPATLSHKVLTGVLREQLGFEGLIITDCMQMKAIANGIGAVQGSIQAINAGVDLLLVCHSLNVQQSVFEAVLKAVESGVIAEETINRAVERILKAKAFLFESDFETPEQPWHDGGHRLLEARIANAAVTFLGDPTLLPIPQENVAILSFHPAGEKLADALAERGIESTFYTVSQVAQGRTIGELNASEDRSNAPVLLDEAAAFEIASGRDQLLILTCLQEVKNYKPEQYEAQISLVHKLIEKHPNAILLALREPYDRLHYPNAKAFLTAYSYRSSALNALADALTGRLIPEGKLPVSV